MYKTKEPGANSVECSICQFVVTYVDKVIQSNRSEAAIEAALDKVCTILPHALNATCFEFVKDYGPVLVELLEKYGSPDVVCAALGLCKNGTEETREDVGHGLNVKQSNIKSIECSLCKFIVGYVEKSIENNKSEAAIVAALEKVCDILPHAVKEDCDKFVTEYGPTLVELIEKYSTPDAVCEALGVCKKDTTQLSSLKHSQSTELKTLSVNSAQCTLCEFILNYVDKSIGNNRSAAAVEAALDKVCDVLPTPVRTNCTDFVHKYGLIISILFAKNATPEQVCDYLKLCNNGTQQIASQESHMYKTKELQANPAECALCKYVVSYLDGVIQTNKSEAAIEAALEKVCTILPHTLNASCIKFVETYGPKLVEYLLNYTTADKVCVALTLCKNHTEEVKPAIVEEAKPEPSSDNSVECSICQFVVTYIDKTIQSNKSEAAIEAALEKVCTILPRSVNATCVEFVETFGPILVQLLEKYTTPDLVCVALGLCKNGTEIAESVSQTNVQSVKNEIECTLCKYVISFVNTLLESNATEQEITKGLENVCSIWPKESREKCDNFVKTYGPILPQLIAELDDPNVVCAWLAFCPKADKKFIDIPALKSKNLNSFPCTLCEYLVNYLDAIIKSNATEIHFEEELEKACKILPTTKVQSECRVLVDLFGEDMIKFLVEFGSPDRVCKAIGICDK